MPLPDGSEDVAEAFADAVVKQNWDALPPLMTADAAAAHPPAALAAAFGWATLGPKLKSEWLAATGEDPASVPDLDPPARFEVYEVEDREIPSGHDPEVMIGWAVISFFPGDESEFDTCYDCYLTIVEREDGPKVTGYTIELVTD